MLSRLSSVQLGWSVLLFCLSVSLTGGVFPCVLGSSVAAQEIATQDVFPLANVSRINEFRLSNTRSSHPTAITNGPDGNLWFTELFGNRIGQDLLSGTPGTPTIVISSITAPNTAKPDGKIPVENTVTNQGAQTASSVTINFYLSNDTQINTDDIRIGKRTVKNLAPGASSGPASLQPNGLLIRR
jgi:hypothetical protein